MEEKNRILSKQRDEELLFAKIKQMLDNARMQIAHTVNATTVEAYWQVGKYIVLYEQAGNVKAQYGKGIINRLSKRLTAEYGGGFSPANIRYMRQFYLYYPICHALRDKLSWTHWRKLLTAARRKANFRRSVYDISADTGGIETSALRRQ